MNAFNLPACVWSVLCGVSSLGGVLVNEKLMAWFLVVKSIFLPCLCIYVEALGEIFSRTSPIVYGKQIIMKVCLQRY